MTTLDPETEQMIRELNGPNANIFAGAAAAHMRKLATELAETKAELERLREAVRWLSVTGYYSARAREDKLWKALVGNRHRIDSEPIGDDPAASLIRFHERNKP